MVLWALAVVLSLCCGQGGSVCEAGCWVIVTAPQMSHSMWTVLLMYDPRLPNYQRRVDFLSAWLAFNKQSPWRSISSTSPGKGPVRTHWQPLLNLGTDHKGIHVRVVGLLVPTGGHQWKDSRGIEGIGKDGDEEEEVVVQAIPSDFGVV